MRITKESGIPLMGCIAFGVIDRGTNLLQVRGTSVCNLNCIFCSTDAGSKSKFHNEIFEVDVDYLVEEVKKVVALKGEGIEINLDSVGEPLMYRDIIKLAQKCKEIPGVYRMSMQTNGLLLNEEKIKNLAEAGLDHVNFSLNAMSKDLTWKLSGTVYDYVKVLDNVKHLVKNGISVRICPVWVPGYNDYHIPKIIKFAKENGCALGIQKYEYYKYSRKLKGVNLINWWKFFNQLEMWEKEFDVKLKITKDDVKIEKRPRVSEVFTKGERVQVRIVGDGWYNFQKLAVAKDRCVSVLDCEAEVGDLVNVKMLECKNNIYLAEVVK